LLYVDSNRRLENSSRFNRFTSWTRKFIVATGGTITCCGDYKIHTFTGPGDFYSNECRKSNAGSTTVDYLVVAGGGGKTGGLVCFKEERAGAGGALDNQFSKSSSIAGGLPVTAQVYPITVGAGGAGGILVQGAAVLVHFRNKFCIFNNNINRWWRGWSGRTIK
jgi:hypothetical protein